MNGKVSPEEKIICEANKEGSPRPIHKHMSVNSRNQTPEYAPSQLLHNKSCTFYRDQTLSWYHLCARWLASNQQLVDLYGLQILYIWKLNNLRLRAVLDTWYVSSWFFTSRHQPVRVPWVWPCHLMYHAAFQTRAARLSHVGTRSQIIWYIILTSSQLCEGRYRFFTLRIITLPSINSHPTPSFALKSFQLDSVIVSRNFRSTEW